MRGGKYRKKITNLAQNYKRGDSAEIWKPNEETKFRWKSYIYLKNAQVEKFQIVKEEEHRQEVENLSNHIIANKTMSGLHVN